MSAGPRPCVAAELAEVVDALDMPRAVVRRWLEQSTRFCLDHGGRRYYAELLDLYAEALTVLPPADR